MIAKAETSAGKTAVSDVAGGDLSSTGQLDGRVSQARHNDRRRAAMGSFH